MDSTETKDTTGNYNSNNLNQQKKNNDKFTEDSGQDDFPEHEEWSLFIKENLKLIEELENKL